MLNAMYDVFLSYNRSDPKSHLVSDLRDKFAGDQCSVFFDEKGLTQGKGGKIQETLSSALRNTKLILVLVGEAGLGPSQVEEVAIAREFADGARNSGERWPEVVVVRLGNFEIMQLESLIPDHLHGELYYSFPPYPGEASYKELKHKLLETPRVSAEGAAAGQPAEGTGGGSPQIRFLKQNQLKKFKEQVESLGITVFLGTRWPDRTCPGVFNPDQFAAFLREECGVPQEIANIEPERLASYAQVSFGDSARTVERFRRLFGTRPTRVYTEVARLFDLLCDKQRQVGDKDRPCIIVSTAQNALIEREFLRLGMSFLLLSVDHDKARQTFFDVESTSPLKIGNGKGLNFDSNVRRLLSAGEKERGRAENLSDWEKCEAQVVQDVPEDPEKTVNYNYYRENVYTDKGSSGVNDAWVACELDRVVEMQINQHSINTTWDPDAPSPRNIDKTTENDNALINWCRLNHVPIVIKLCGCVYDESRIGLRLERIAAVKASKGMLPNWLVAEIKKSPTLFAGFSAVEYGFQTIYWRDFRQLLIDQPGDRKSRYFLSSEVVEDLAEREPDVDDLLASCIENLERDEMQDRDIVRDFNILTGIAASDALVKLRAALGTRED